MLAIHALNTDNEEVRSMNTRQSGVGMDGPFNEEGVMQHERLFSKVKRHLKTLSILGVHIGAAFLLRQISFRYFSK
jgi:hypothetical protein